MNTEASSSPLAFFAAEMKRLRGIAAMTQEALANAAGYAPATIAAVETCRLLPSQELAEQVDKALRTDGHFARLQSLVEQTSVLPWFRDLVIDESVLRREVGGGEVMREQCEHLLLTGQRPHIAIQVIPDVKGATCAYGQQFMVLTFGKRSPMAYLEDMRSARYVRERDEVGTYSMTFDYLRSNALDDQQSADLIRGYKNERYI